MNTPTNQFIPTTRVNILDSEKHKLLIKAGIRFYTEVSVRIPKPVVDRYFDAYYLVFWKAKFVLDKMTNGTIARENITYQVRFMGGTTRGQLLESPHEQVSLSFRAPIQEFGILPTVLIGSI